MPLKNQSGRRLILSPQYNFIEPQALGGAIGGQVAFALGIVIFSVRGHSSELAGKK